MSRVSIIRGSVLSSTAGRITPQFALVVRHDRTDVELPHGIPQEVNQALSENYQPERARVRFLRETVG